MHIVYITAFRVRLFLSICYALAPRSNGQSIFSGIYVANSGPFACRYDEIQKINDSIPDARTLANAATRALSVPGSENAIAYSAWFGEGNAKIATRELILYHYQAVINNFMPIPSTDAANVEIYDYPPYSTPQLPDTALVYACGQEDVLCINNPNLIAETFPYSMTNGRRRFGFTAIIFCDNFFNAPSQEQMIESWRNNSIFQTTMGSTLLHEFQHSDLVQGQDNRCVKDIYLPLKPRMLSAAEKMDNAENYVLYAMDALAFPDIVRVTFPAVTTTPESLSDGSAPSTALPISPSINTSTNSTTSSITSAYFQIYSGTSYESPGSCCYIMATCDIVTDLVSASAYLNEYFGGDWSFVDPHNDGITWSVAKLGPCL